MRCLNLLLIVLSLNLYSFHVESKQFQEVDLETVIADEPKGCSGRYREKFFTNLTQTFSDDCYRAWKYGVSYASELRYFYSVLCQPGCRAALGRLEEECGFPMDAEYSKDKLRQVCARNEVGENCYSLALDRSSEVSLVYAECWEEEEEEEEGRNKHCSAKCEEAIGM